MNRLTKLRHILPRSTKIKLVLLQIGIIIGGLIETLTISIIQPFIFIMTDPEIVYTNRFINAVYSFFGFGDVVRFLAFLAVVIAGVYAFRGFYVHLFAKIQNKVIAKNTMELTNRLLLYTLKEPYLFHTGKNVAKLQMVVNIHSSRLFMFINSTLSFMIDASMSLFILIFLFISSTSMTLVVVVLASIGTFVHFRYFKDKIVQSAEAEEIDMAAISKTTLQALYGIKEIKPERLL